MPNKVYVILRECVLTTRGIKPLVLRPTYFPGSVPYLSINALETGEIKEYTFKELANLANESDVLVVWDGSRSGLALMGKTGALGSTIVALTPLGIDSEYLYYFIKSKYDFINKNSTGSGIPHVDANLFFSLEIPFTDLETQREIVKGINKKLEQNRGLLANQDQIVDDLLATTNFKYPKGENAERSLSNFKRTVLLDAFSGRLTDTWRMRNKQQITTAIDGDYQINDSYRKLTSIPNSWTWNALGNIADCKRGRFSARPRNDPQFFGGPYPFIQIGDIKDDGSLINSHKQTLNEEGIKVSKCFSAGTLVIAIVGSSIGNSGMLGYDMYFPDSIVGISVSEAFDSEFVLYYLQLEKENIRSLSYSSGGQPNLKIEFINKYPLPCPPIEEQREIVKKVKILLDTTHDIQLQYSKASALFVDLEKAIIHDAFVNVETDMNQDEIQSILKTLKEIAETDRQKFQKNNSIIRSNMKKQITATSELDIEDVLNLQDGPMSAKDVWDQSKYRGNIDAFYEALKHKKSQSINWEIKDPDSDVPLSILSLKN